MTNVNIILIILLVIALGMWHHVSVRQSAIQTMVDKVKSKISTLLPKQ